MPVPVAETGYARDPMDAAVSVASADAPASTDWWATMAASLREVKRCSRDALAHFADCPNVV